MEKKKKILHGLFWALACAVALGAYFYFSNGADTSVASISSDVIDLNASSGISFASSSDTLEEYDDANGESAFTAGKIAAAGTPSPKTVPKKSSDAAIAPKSCTFSLAATSSKEIRLNEIAWMGSPAETGETSAHAVDREWIELKNITSRAVDLYGWEVMDATGAIKITFNDHTMLSANGLYLLARSDGDKNYSGALANGGDALEIFNPQCAVSDVLDAARGWPGGNNDTKQTLERDADGDGWHTSVLSGGTPRAENSVPPAPPASVLAPTSTLTTSTPIATSVSTEPSLASSSPPPVSVVIAPPTSQVPSSTPTSTPASVVSSTVALASSSPSIASSSPAPTQALSSLSHLLITAIQISGASSSNDFIRIFNPNSSIVDISGWKLRKRSSSGADYSIRTFPSGSAVAPKSVFLWANSSGGFSTSVHADVSSTQTLSINNSVALFNASDTPVDEVAWGTGDGQFVEGSPFDTSPSDGQMLIRKLVNGVPVDTENNASDFTLQ